MGGLEVCRSALMIVLWSSAVNPLSTSLPLLSLLSTSPSSLSAIFFLVSGSLISVNTLLNVLLFYTRPLWSAYGSLLRHRFLTAVGSGRFWKGQSVPKISPWTSLQWSFSLRWSQSASAAEQALSVSLWPPGLYERCHVGKLTSEWKPVESSPLPSQTQDSNCTIETTLWYDILRNNMPKPQINESLVVYNPFVGTRSTICTHKYLLFLLSHFLL